MRKIFKRSIVVVAGAVMFFNLLGTSNVWAEPSGSPISLTVSPLIEHVVLTPGEVYKGSFKVANPAEGKNELRYNIEVQPFYVDEEYETIFEDVGGRNIIRDWITIDSEDSGILLPSTMIDVNYTIDVPVDAPAGGQYVDIRVISSSADSTGENQAAIGERVAIGHLIFAEVAGKSVRQGEIIDVDIPSFLLSGDIAGSSAIRNTGNVHSIATYKLQIFPLFSDEELYTNEESPDQKTILPDRTLYNETSWEQTPTVGIFNVVYTVEFEGVTAQVSKMVIKCPIWLLFVIIFVIFALIFYFVARARARKKAKKQ